jgi:hypothetical protein
LNTQKTAPAAGLALFLLFIAPRIAQAQTAFNPACHPFKSLEAKHPIDTGCASAAGNAHTAGSPRVLQNVAKNNFCAAGPPVDITHDALLQLQAAAESLFDYSTWGRNKLPPSRDPFTQMKGRFREGMLVRYTGFVYELHAADTSNGESVNCNIGGSEANDIHIAFVADPTDPECSSITAEMSPHFRPKAWVARKMAPWVSAVHKHNGVWVANPQGTRLSRVTGQLMFDAAHKPCTDGKANTGDPARASLWEVHPVYSMDVCKTTGSTCADADWEPLDQFLSTTTATGTTPQHHKPASR